MYIHEYGDPSLPKIILLHPMEVTGEELYRLFSAQLKKQYCIICPDQGGHGLSSPYISAEKETAALEKYLLEKDYHDFRLLFAASMGAAVGYRLMMSGLFRFEHIWFDGVAVNPGSKAAEVLMREMFILKHRDLAKHPDKPAENLRRMYGPEMAEMMKRNFIKLSESDIANICYACTHYDLHILDETTQSRIHLEYGENDPDLKVSQKSLGIWWPHVKPVVRTGYGHCGYMAFHTEEYVNEIEALMES